MKTLLLAWLVAFPAIAVAETVALNGLVEKDLTSSTFGFTQTLDVVNQTGLTWTEFHLRVSTESVSGEMGFGFAVLSGESAYSGPGTATYSEYWNGFPTRVDVTGLSIPEGSTYSFEISTTARGFLQPYWVIGQPTGDSPTGYQQPGDANQDGNLDIADAMALFGFLFAGQPALLPCGDGSLLHETNVKLLDWGGDRRIDMADGVALLSWKFRGSLPHVLGPRCVWIPGCPTVCAAFSEPAPVVDPPSKIFEFVDGLSPNASRAEIDIWLERILFAVATITRRDMPLLRDALSLLGDQPEIIAALVDAYDATPREDYGRRRLLVSLVGELQRSDAYAFLESVASAPLPEEPNVAEGITERNREITLQIKAVHGIGFLRGADGVLDSRGEEETLRLALEHPSRAVRVAAIDTYMWNHGDSVEAATTLYGRLPAESHKYVEMPRFHAGANAENFRRRLAAWRDRWAQ